MKIIVCVKQVPDTTEIKIDPVTNTLIRAGVPSIVNPMTLSPGNGTPFGRKRSWGGVLVFPWSRSRPKKR